MKLVTSSYAAERPRSRPVRCGHTLFEVLVALGLSLALLAAVYSALDLHWKYSVAGQEEMERLQLVRALFVKIEGDVRSIVYRRPSPVVHPQSGGAVPQGPAASTARSVVTQASDPYDGYGIGLVGDAHRLLLQVNEAARDSPSLVPEPAAEQSRKVGNRVHGVLWFISRSRGSADRLNNPIASLNEAEQSKKGTLQATGLTRLAADRVPFDSLDMHVNPEDDATPGDVLADEVRTIGFRYFDGSQWLDQWDSVAMGRLPRAVEIEIGFDMENSTLRDFDEKKHSGRYRLVVAIPAYET